MRISPNLPFYHDGFIDYGFNQIAYFEHLRLRGYQMQILGDGYLIDPPRTMYDVHFVYNQFGISD